jgi:curved DNA-binding protein CbpA
MKPIPDPYRVLGVQRGADADEVKAAHRRLAKRYHPDGGSGDEQRFLVVQDAYQLLSDPVLRREWDRRHSARPMDAHDRAGRAPTRAASTRWTREDASTYRRRPMSRRERRRADARAEGSGRDPRTRRHTWSAEGVPWWEDFSPKRGRATDEPEAPTKPQERARGDPVESAADGSATSDQGAVPDFDVYNRSSGAAWSMAARRHFRRDDADLPSRGAFRYRGTQVVTGAEARKVAAEEAAADADAREAERQRLANEEALFRRSAQATASPRPATESDATPRSATGRQAEPPSAATPQADEPSSRVSVGPQTSHAAMTAPGAADAPARPTAASGAPAAQSISTAPGSRPADDAKATLSSAGPATPARLGAAAGAVIAPVSVLAGAGAFGALDGAPDATLVLLAIVCAMVGGAIGRSLVRRRNDADGLDPRGGDVGT